MATGTVKWFNNAKGYGFVLSEDKSEDLFIHYSSIQMDGYKSLKAGQEVEYDVQEGPKGMHAVNIRCSGAAVADNGSEPAVHRDPTEDNLHLNPMHRVPTPPGTTSPGKGSTTESASVPEPEVAID